MAPYEGGAILAAIDVGTNAVRLEMARPRADGALESLHAERDPVRPGEGVFTTGRLSPGVADRLLGTLRRYGALCRRYDAQVRAVATSAIREAKNGPDIVKRARREAGIELQVIHGMEEARLICLGVLHGKPKRARSLVIDLGGGSTEIASAIGETPTSLWTVAMGAVRLAEVFEATGTVSDKRLGLLRKFAAEAAHEVIPRPLRNQPRTAIGSSGTIRALVGHCASPGTAHATLKQIRRAVDELAATGLTERRALFEPQRAEIIVAGGVVLEAVMKQCGVRSITTVDRGLRHGILLDMVRRLHAEPGDDFLIEAAVAIGRRFDFDERHGRQVSRIALRLFDELARLHRLPAAARPYLEVAALLHDVGNAVSYQGHHKHAYYLIRNLDMVGLSDHERELVALIARFHRKSPPETTHWALEDLSPTEARMVRKLATLLRVADSLDRSRQQAVKDLHAAIARSTVSVRLRATHPVDLELWDAANEMPLFRRVFGRKLQLHVARARGR